MYHQRGLSLDQQRSDIDKQDLFNLALAYIESSAGLKIRSSGGLKLELQQTVDQKLISIDFLEVGEVLKRFDAQNKDFLQINFSSGKKILVTDTLIGFKPIIPKGLTLDRLPKVVTTSDMVNVLEAIEETLMTATAQSEIDTLKRIFSAILGGAEAVGFECREEREWLRCIPLTRASA